MSVYFNPAAGLTAQRVPYSPGGGRLANSGATWNALGLLQIDAATATEVLSLSKAGGNKVHLGPVSSSDEGLQLKNSGGAQTHRFCKDGQILIGGNLDGICPSSGPGFMAVGSSQHIRITDNSYANPRAVFLHTQRTLFGGKTTDDANGVVQVLSHSSFAGGFAFGNDATGEESIWRAGSGVLKTAGDFQAKRLYCYNGGAGEDLILEPIGSDVLSLYSPSTAAWKRLWAGYATGWGMPTPTLDRTTFDPATVTLANLAKRVAALITDLHMSGSAHGLLNI